MIGKSFAKTTSDTMTGLNFTKGSDMKVEDRFQSTQQSQFNKNSFRRLAKEIMDPAQTKDQKDMQAFGDFEFHGIHSEKKSPLLDIPTAGYQGYKSPYKQTSPRIYHRKAPEFDLNSLGAKVRYADLESKKEF